MAERRKSYTSRNSKNHWSRRNYTYYEGQRVLWPEGTKNGIPFGTMGTVVSLPKPGSRILLVALDGRPSGYEFTGGEIIPLRKVWEEAAKNLSRSAKSYRDALKDTDDLGVLKPRTARTTS